MGRGLGKEEKDCFYALDDYRNVLNDIIYSDDHLRDTFCSFLESSLNMKIRYIDDFFLPGFEYDKKNFGKDVYRRIKKAYKKTEMAASGNKDFCIFYRLVNDTISYIYEKNIGLVFDIRKKFRMLEIEDAVQAGSIGLLKAIDYFDVSKDLRLSTYATWHIRQQMHLEKVKNTMKKIPSYALHEKKIIDANIAKYVQQNYEVPSIDELSKTTGFDKKKISTLIGSHITNFSDFEEGFESFISSKREDDPEKQCSQSIEMKLINKELDDMDYREREIIRLRFGISEHGHSYTLEEISRIFNITRERIRQIELKTMKKLQRRLNIKNSLVHGIERF